MTTSELRKALKEIIIAQGGKLYNYNFNNLNKMYGVSYGDMQNAMNYLQFSPQQANFRAAYNFH